jgi:hypothetical protein
VREIVKPIETRRGEKCVYFSSHRIVCVNLDVRPLLSRSRVVAVGFGFEDQDALASRATLPEEAAGSEVQAAATVRAAHPERWRCEL